MSNNHFQAPRVLLINGPNLGLLGQRQPEIYGHSTLADVESSAKDQAATLGGELKTYQSNHEGYIIDRIHEARGEVDVIVINAASAML